MFDSLFPKHWSTLQRLMWLKTNALARAVYEIVTGNPVSFTAKAAPLRKLEVAFSPVQSLNGYDAPWPAGGGANKWDEEWEIGGIATSDGSNVSQYTTIRSVNYIPVIGGESYYIKCPSDASAYLFFYDSSKAYIGNSGGYKTEAQTVPSGAAFMRFQMSAAYGTTYNRDIAINYPATVTTYSPYSNECPISGWSSLHVYDDPLYAGVIEWNQLIKTRDFASGTTDTRNVVYCVFRQYSSPYTTISADSILETGKLERIVTPTFTGRASILHSGTQRNISIYEDSDFTVQSGHKYFLSLNFTGIDLSVVGGLTVSDMMCADLTEMFGTGNEPATVEAFKALFPHDYYPYNAGTETLVGTVNGMDTRSISISLGQTVYSGTVDVLTGVVTMTMASVDLGTLTWTKGGTSGAHWRFSAPTPTPAPKVPAVSAVANALCSVYRAVTANQTWTGAAKGITFNIDGKILIADEDYADETALTTALTGQTLVYEIAEPFTIQLTPQEVESLAGDNTLWSDANQPMTVTYRSN